MQGGAQGSRGWVATSIVVLFAAAGPAGLGAQTLADVARQNRRAAQSQPANLRTYTNEDLQKISDAPASEMLVVTKPAQGTEVRVIPPNIAFTPSSVEPTGGREAFWRKKAADAAEAQVKAEKDVEDLQNQYNLMTNQWSGADDPAWRDSLRQQLDLLGKKLEETKKRLETATENLKNLPDEARKANIPPGWVRQ